MKTLIVGDIHGCYVELQELLATAGIAEDDTIIALGDIVDRGPETPQVLDFFHLQPNARSLMGNHERKHMRGARGEVELAMSQIIARGQFGDAYADALAWMAAFPLYIDLPHAILVHGYLEPDVLLEQQLEIVLCGTMGGDRYLQNRYDQPWYALYKGDKPVIVGHHDYLRNGQLFVYQDRIFGLDTSCVHGKRLTGITLPDFNIFSVPSRGDLWNDMRRQYRQQNPAAQTGKSRLIKYKQQPVPLNEESINILHAIMERAHQANARVLASLHEQPDYEDLTPRQQAIAFSAKIGDDPLAIFMQIARKGELNLDRAHKMLKDAAQIVSLAEKIGIC